MTGDLRHALRTLALASPAGAPVTFTLPREDLLELVDGNGAGHEAPARESAPPDRLLTVPEAAARLAVSVRYLYAHADRPPFKSLIVRVGRKVLVSEGRLARWLERRPAA